MEIWKVYRNGYLSNVYLSEDEAKSKVASSSRIVTKSLREVDGKDVWVDVPDTYEIVQDSAEPVTFDVYLQIVGRGGNRASYATYEEAKSVYDLCVKNGRSVLLQIPLSQFGGIACTTIEEHTTESFKREEREFFRRLEDEETEKYYSPGNPWDAPGMSIYDFI